MTYGFKIKNDDGQLLVQSSFRTPHYRGQATLIGTWAGISSLQEYRITTGSDQPPLAFVRPTGTGHRFAVLYMEAISSTQWRIIVATNTPCEVHVFAQFGVIGPAGQWGIRVLDESGRTAFDSTRSPLTLAGLFSFPASDFDDTPHIAVGTTVPTGLSIPAVSGGAASFAGEVDVPVYTRTFVGTYTWNFNGTMTLRTSGLEFGAMGSPSSPGAILYRSFVVAHTGLVVDLAPYI